jgi:hypothetical protein
MTKKMQPLPALDNDSVFGVKSHLEVARQEVGDAKAGSLGGGAVFGKDNEIVAVAKIGERLNLAANEAVEFV